MGLLESALHRPQTGYDGDVAEMAAALFESLLMSHSFLIGALEQGRADFDNLLTWIRESVSR